VKVWRCYRALTIAAVSMSGSTTLGVVPSATAAPAPEMEYVYDVTMRRHYNFPNPGDAVGCGYGICDKVGRGNSYAQVMDDVKLEVAPADEASANYLVSYAVNLLCPALIWQLRNSAAGYQPAPTGSY
jgi:Protein of unknown function (DUF732)